MLKPKKKGKKRDAVSNCCMIPVCFIDFGRSSFNISLFNLYKTFEISKIRHSGPRHATASAKLVRGKNYDSFVYTLCGV